MKKIYTVLLLFALSTSVFTAQNSKTKKADKLYEQLQYTDAADAYQKLLKKGENSHYVYERLAHSYFYINDTKKAETYYKRIIKNKNVDSETVYNYAQSLKANGSFSEYNAIMRKFAEMKPQDSRGIDFMKDPDYLPRIMDENSQRYSATNLNGLNSKYSDFGGTIVGNDFYFTSARDTKGKNYDWNDEPFLDIYKASIIGGVIKNPELVKGDVNTKYHESSVSITPDGKRMYFDRNDFYKGKYKKSNTGINQINIYYAENVDGLWKDIKSVPFNSHEYSTGHPTLSPDGNTLYFSSDRPGGKGDSDIYTVSIDAEGNFGEPVALGGEINTEGKEVFPFVDSNGTLYFSSNGHLGMGGLDVFATEAIGNEFGKVKNLGLGVNSSGDDFAFSYDPATEVGYVSSNRKAGKGSDDIYRINKLETCDVNLNILVVDAETNKPLSGARLDLFDNKENKLKSQMTDASGKGKLVAACDQNHVVQAFMAGYESNAGSVDASKEGDKELIISLRPIDQIAQDGAVKLNPILFDFDRHNIKPQAAFELDKLVELMKKNPEIKINVEAHTDTRGSTAYNQNLSDRRAKSTVQYVISKGIDKVRISGKGYGKNRPAQECGSNCSEEQHHKNRRSEFIIVK